MSSYALSNPSPELRARRSLRDLQAEYDSGNTEPLTKLVRAWYGIQNLPPTDQNSFFLIAGYHGEPFRGAGWGNAQWWGGYCNHGNVLFPTWHRAYLVRLENALRSIPGCEDVAMAYWDETDLESKSEGLPAVLTAPTFPLDGKDIPNPLKSYTFQAGVWDNLSPDPLTDYTKPTGYQTVRFPYSGLVGTEADREATEAHNAQYTPEEANAALNSNVELWLGDGPLVNAEGQEIPTKTAYKYAQCLNAPNYTVFSNVTSAAQWNEDHFNTQSTVPTEGPSPTPGSENPVVPLESPHNDMHLAVGGFDIDTPAGGDVDPAEYKGANGDMGENDTASFDPAFWFHHCYVDYVFWQWQLKSESRDELSIIEKYPGTNSVDSQGPTPGVSGGVWLTLDTPLDPFVKDDGSTPCTSKDVVNIESQLGYTYVPPLSSTPTLPVPGLPRPPLELPKVGLPTHVLRISGLNRAAVPGSFVIQIKVNVDGRDQVVATESVLSRWRVSGCANCQTHLSVKTFLPLRGLRKNGEKLKPEEVTVEVVGRGAKGKPKEPIKLKPRIQLGVIGKDRVSART